MFGKVSRRSFLSALAGLPVVGKLFAEAPPLPVVAHSDPSTDRECLFLRDGRLYWAHYNKPEEDIKDQYFELSGGESFSGFEYVYAGKARLRATGGHYDLAWVPGQFQETAYLTRADRIYRTTSNVW